MNSSMEIQDAASVILFHSGSDTPKILMGKRDQNAVFMPSMYVFPGGAVEPVDHGTPFLVANQVKNFTKLSLQADPKLGEPLLNCALRELAEETGIELVKCDFSSNSISFIMRAITPHGMSRRFDTRFFLIQLSENPNTSQYNNFRNASGELSDLGWVGLNEALDLDIPAITRNVIELISTNVAQGSAIKHLPFYREGSFQELTYL